MCEEIIRLKGREDNSKENRKERKEREMDHKELIDKMDQFAERVLQGGGNVTPQETAVLPQVLEMLLSEKPPVETDDQKEKEAKIDEDNHKNAGNKDCRNRQICGNGNSEEHSERTGKSWVDRRRSEAAS